MKLAEEKQTSKKKQLEEGIKILRTKTPSTKIEEEKLKKY